MSTLSVQCQCLLRMEPAIFSSFKMTTPHSGKHVSSRLKLKSRMTFKASSPDLRGRPEMPSCPYGATIEENSLVTTAVSGCSKEGYSNLLTMGRVNRTTIEAMRTELHAKGLPESMWADGVKYSADAQNCTQNSKVDATPFELWYGRKPIVSHMLGTCTVRVYITDNERKKLDAMS